MDFSAAYLLDSSSVAPADAPSSKSKLLASIPTCSVKWLQVLKRCTDLLFLVFTPPSPLYHKCLEMVKVLWEYPSEVVAQLLLHTKASFLGILHLQSQPFSQRK